MTTATTHPADQARSSALDQRSVDAAIVRDIRSGSQSALRTAYELYSGHVNGVAIGILKDRDLAADITQEVFVRLWNRHDRFDADRGSLKAFLQMDAHGRSIDLLRSRRAAAARELADHHKTASTAIAGTEELAMNAVTSDVVRSALMKLPEDQRTPIALAYFDGFSYRDVAQRLGVPEGTVKSRIRTGMRRLKLAIGSEAL